MSISTELIGAIAGGGGRPLCFRGYINPTERYIAGEAGKTYLVIFNTDTGYGTFTVNGSHTSDKFQTMQIVTEGPIVVTSRGGTTSMVNVVAIEAEKFKQE